MDAAEVEFLAEKELVTIIPNFSLDKIYLIGVRTAGPPARSGGLPLPAGWVVGAQARRCSRAGLGNRCRVVAGRGAGRDRAGRQLADCGGPSPALVSDGVCVFAGRPGAFQPRPTGAGTSVAGSQPEAETEVSKGLPEYGELQACCIFLDHGSN